MRLVEFSRHKPWVEGDFRGLHVLRANSPSRSISLWMLSLTASEHARGKGGEFEGCEAKVIPIKRERDFEFSE